MRRDQDRIRPGTTTRRSLVSSYFFIRQQRATLLKSRITEGTSRRDIARQLINTVAARALPFSVWAIVFPMRDGARYFLDDDGRICVDGLGCLDRLSEDLEVLLSEAGVDTGDRAVGHVNRSRHAKATKYVTPNSLLERVLRRRYAKDVALHALVADGPIVGCEGVRPEVAAGTRPGWPSLALG